ncbi:hypothetical protein HNP86_001797 [Methanococcus maripaludis]|uniref:Uncharacterized protein n=1 Tax=Methanococcus maripaludis TaxID=39152 RepID=A0A7J9NVD5_METMI|nr:hypothetical protein [Methanococcus maripaludis]MBA2851638.1 hypothetical protein [Methanococcus maripaludis]
MNETKLNDTTLAVTLLALPQAVEIMAEIVEVLQHEDDDDLSRQDKLTIVAAKQQKVECVAGIKTCIEYIEKQADDYVVNGQTKNDVLTELNGYLTVLDGGTVVGITSREKIISELRSVLKTQKLSTTEDDQYMVGLHNGIAMCISLITGEESDYFKSEESN